jgi:integrase
MIGFVMHAGFEAGLRRNEIVEARPSWFSLKGRSLRVQKTETFRPKDREARAVPLTDVFIAFV